MKGITETDLASIAAARAEGPFRSLEDFCRRTTVHRDVIERLILCGAFDRLSPSRRTLLWQFLRDSEGAREREDGTEAARQLTLDVETEGLNGETMANDGIASSFSRSLAPPLPRSLAVPPVGEATLYERVQWEMATLGMAVEAHPNRLFAPLLAPHAPVTARDLARAAHGRRVTVAGVVVCRMRPPTRSGTIVLFITLEDETGLIDTVIFPTVYEAYGAAAFSSDLLVIEGKVQRQGRSGVTLIAQKIVAPLADGTEETIDGGTGVATRRLPLRELQALDEEEDEADGAADPES